MAKATFDLIPLTSIFCRSGVPALNNFQLRRHCIPKSVVALSSFGRRPNAMNLNTKTAFIPLLPAVAGWGQGQVRMRAGLWENSHDLKRERAVTRKACIASEQEEYSKGS